MGSGMENKSVDKERNRNLSQNCLGNTGLHINSLDAFEKTGCNYNDDNFLKYIRCRTDDQLYIMINNHTNSKGFDIHFEGDVVPGKHSECGNNDMTYTLDDIEIHPNPTSNFLQIKLDLETPGILDINILDFTGKEVLHFEEEVRTGYNRINLSLKELPSGTYILSTRKGDKRAYKQFVKI